MHFKPLNDRIVLQRKEAEEKSKGGIIIPDAAKEKPAEGVVRAVGNGARMNDGTQTPPAVKVGDRVLFHTYAGTEIVLDGEKLLVVNESDLFAVLE